MGIDDLAGKAGGALGGDKTEQISDGAIDKGEDAVSNATGGKGDAAITKAGDAADERIGQ
jgi:hypothetical protein